MQELRFEKKSMQVAQLGEEASVPDLLGILQTQNLLAFQDGIEKEIFGGYGRVPTGYPYRQYDNYDRELQEREVQTAILENESLRAVFLPEFGGRLWELWDKKSGKNLLYTNDVIRFSNLAVRNAWFSGGVEWNISVIGHTPLTTEPLYVAKTVTAQGDPVLRMYEYERIRGVVWQMDFWLEKDCPFLNCRMRIVNESPETIPMYWWSNIAVPEYPHGRVIVPADRAYTNGKIDGKATVYKVEIPVVDCVDVTDYNQIPSSVDYFFDIPEQAPKFIANVDRNGFGLLQMSTKRLQGRKLFSWGHMRGSGRWQEFLTEQAGPYVEIQAGLAKTQYGCIPMEGGAVWEWLERYGAVQVPEEDVKDTHERRTKNLAERLLGDPGYKSMEQVLAETAEMAVGKAEPVSCGKGYGALPKYGPSEKTTHLEFVLKEKSLQNWKGFLESHVLHTPNPMERPDVFFIDGSNVSLLEEYMDGENSRNWYAWYQLGLGYFLLQREEEAEQAFQNSLKLAENPWACHGLSCVCLRQADREQNPEKRREAVRQILRGIDMNREDLSYLKEGLRILLSCGICEGYEAVCAVYEKLGEKKKEVGRLRFCYLTALHRLGRDKEAWTLLEEKGMEMPDVREAEDGPAELWLEIYRAVHKADGELPYQYDFRCTKQHLSNTKQ